MFVKWFNRVSGDPHGPLEWAISILVSVVIVLSWPFVMLFAIIVVWCTAIANLGNSLTRRGN